MAFAQWMRVLDTVGGLVQMAARLRRPDPNEPTGLQNTAGAGGPLGQLETRLTGVVVAALQEAFNRDSARLDLERTQIEAERQRAEQALQAELRRQAADRVLGQLRLIAVMAIGTWALSAALGVWLPGMRDGVPRMLLAGGWLLVFASLASAFAGWQHISVWSSNARGGVVDLPQSATIAAAPWLLIAALVLTGASLLTGL
jgi:hypothetical protein